MKPPVVGGKPTPKAKPRGNFDARGVAIDTSAKDVPMNKYGIGTSSMSYNEAKKNEKSLYTRKDDEAKMALADIRGLDNPFSAPEYSHVDLSKKVANPRGVAKYEAFQRKMQGAQKQYGQGIMTGQAKSKALVAARSKVKGK